MEAGEIAFLKHTTVQEMIDGRQFADVTVNDFELLCKNGQRSPISEYLNCNWGVVPTDALVVSSARKIEERKQYQKFLLRSVKMYASPEYKNQSYTSNSNGNKNNFDDPYSRFGSNNNNNFQDRNSRFQTPSPNRFGNDLNDDLKNTSDLQLYEEFNMFGSRRYEGRLNLMFQA